MQQRIHNVVAVSITIVAVSVYYFEFSGMPLSCTIMFFCDIIKYEAIMVPSLPHSDVYKPPRVRGVQCELTRAS